MIAELRGSDGGETQIASDELGPEALLIEMAAKGATFYSRFALKKLLLRGRCSLSPQQPVCARASLGPHSGNIAQHTKKPDHRPGLSQHAPNSDCVDSTRCSDA